MSHSDEVYGQLSSFLQELYTILDAATTMAVDDCQSRGRPIDDSFLAAYVRDETKGRLRELAGTPLECEVKALNNGGIQVVHQGFAIRVRKERDGGLPVGQSQALRQYFEQLPLALVWPGDAEPITSPTTLNLVVFWDFDYETQTLAGVDLVLPHEWRISVLHPADQLQPGVAPVVDYEDVEVDFAEDDDVVLEDQQDEEVEEEDTEEEGGD